MCIKNDVKILFCRVVPGEWGWLETGISTSISAPVCPNPVPSELPISPDDIAGSVEDMNICKRMIRR